MTFEIVLVAPPRTSGVRHRAVAAIAVRTGKGKNPAQVGRDRWLSVWVPTILERKVRARTIMMGGSHSRWENFVIIVNEKIQ